MKTQENAPPGGSSPAREVSLADLALAFGILGVAVFFLAGIFDIPEGSGYARVGPRFFPVLVSGGLLAVGIWLVIDALRGNRAEPAAEEDADPDAPADYRSILWLLAGFVLMILLVQPAGFVIAASLLFWFTARGFHSEKPLRDVAAAIILALVSYVVFTRGLGLMLPAGILQGVL